MEEVNYIELQTERDISGTSFPLGNINFNWTMDNRGYFNPYKTYIKIKCSLSDQISQQIEKADGIAPSMFLADNLFQAMKLQLNNQCLSEIGDYVPQISALKNRMYKSNTDLEDLTANTNFSQSTFTERQAQVIADGLTLGDINNFSPPVHANANATTRAELITDIQTLGKPTRRVQSFEIIFKPPLGFFDIDGFIPCSQGLFNLELTPFPEGIYQTYAIQTNIGKRTPATHYKFQVDSMSMYILKGVGPSIVNKSISLKCNEIRCQSQNLTTPSLHQKTFQIHPKTNALTIAYQNSGAGNDNRYPATMFRCGNSNNLADADELKLERFYLRYGGKQLPTPIPDISFTGVDAVNNLGAKEFLLQRYYETLQYTHLNTSLKNCEPFEKWLERGAYYHFAGYGSHQKEDRCYVSQKFKSFTGNVAPNLLLFDHFCKKININISNGMIKDVNVSDGGT